MGKLNNQQGKQDEFSSSEVASVSTSAFSRNSSTEGGYPYASGNDNNEQQTKLHKRVLNSFKRKEVMIPSDVDLGLMTPYQRRNYILSIQPLKKDALKARHLQMIAIGGSIGTGLFIGLGYSISMGPGAALIGFTIIGFGIYCVIQAGAEMQANIPISGSFAAHITRFIDPALGFTIASNYALAWLISFPSQLIGVSLTIEYWTKDVHKAVWVALAWIFTVCLNLFGVRLYGESEFLLSIIKVSAVFVFCIVGLVLIFGGGPNSTGYIGGRYWNDPGSFVQPVLKSISSTLISAGFAFGGAELAILSSEAAPGSIKRASKQTIWRVALFYITTIIIIGCLVPHNDPRLLRGDNSQDISASPFVIALANTGKFGERMGHFMNAVILVSVLSVGNSCVFASARVVQALGASGQIHPIFAYIDQEGRPLVGIAISAVFGFLGFLVSLANEAQVFTWFFSLCSISSFFTWFSICFAHVRFRLALKSQGRGTEELPFASHLGIYGSYAGMFVFMLVIFGEIWISIWPIGQKANVTVFFQNCLSIPLMIIVFLAYKIIVGGLYDKWYIPNDEIDLDTGKRYHDIDRLKQDKADEQERLRRKPMYYRIYRFLC